MDALLKYFVWINFDICFERVITLIFKGKKNIFVDFGLYDLRKTNGVNYDSSFRAKHPDIDEYGTHAICWLDNLEEPYKSIVKNLPGADEENGKKSDYCK